MTGWTWDEVGKLTLPRLTALNKGWSKHAPLAAMVSSRWGFNKASRTKGSTQGVAETTANEHSELSGMFGGGKSVIDKGLKA